MGDKRRPKKTKKPPRPVVQRDTLPPLKVTPGQKFKADVRRLAAAGKSMTMIPIFSAEDTEHAAGAEHFMGEWLRDSGVAAAESAFLGDFAADPASASVTLGGFQYYEYYFLDQYLP